jgi:hypothetical protein
MAHTHLQRKCGANGIIGADLRFDPEVVYDAGGNRKKGTSTRQYLSYNLPAIMLGKIQ